MIAVFNELGRCVSVGQILSDQPNTTVVELNPQEIDWAKGGWNLILINGVVQRDPSQAMVSLRMKRNELLRLSDWAETSRKLSTAQKNEAIAYRDALFDLPETVTDPWAPNWPIPPAFLIENG